MSSYAPPEYIVRLPLPLRRPDHLVAAVRVERFDRRRRQGHPFDGLQPVPENFRQIVDGGGFGERVHSAKSSEAISYYRAHWFSSFLGKTRHRGGQGGGS